MNMTDDDGDDTNDDDHDNDADNDVIYRGYDSCVEYMMFALNEVKSSIYFKRV